MLAADTSHPQVIEGNTGTTSVVFQVTRERGLDQTVSVDYTTVDGTALAGQDYVAASGVLTFAAGETNKTITVVVNGDTDIENTESFGVHLANAVGGYIAQSQIAALIINDDCSTGLAVNMYPGVTINGCPEKMYRVDVSYDGTTNNWVALPNFVLPTSPYLWIDLISSNSPQRVYRTVLLP